LAEARKKTTIDRMECRHSFALRTWQLLFFVVAVASLSGCRILNRRNENPQLIQARQLSLQGADALERSRAQDAEALFSEAIKHSPLDERAHWGYATTLWERGEKKPAIEHMRQAIQLSGHNPQYQIQFGEMLLSVGRYDEAISSAKTVLSSNHKNAAAWALLGDIHQAKREWKDARNAYQRALLIKSDYPSVQLQLAEVYRTIGKPKTSLALLDRMIDWHETARHDPDALLYRGLALADLNRTEEANETLAKAAERLPPNEIDKQILIVHAQHRIGELVAARMTLGRLRQSHSESPEVQRLQSMLDMSFAHLSDPVKPLSEPRSSESVSTPFLAQPVSTSDLRILR
jgi:tetratricopeptide (TPR) repeat protein